MRAFDDRPNTVPSMKVMPSVESEPDATTSPFSTLSPLLRMIETPLRISGRGAGQLGDMADDLAGARVAIGLRVFDVAGERIDDVAGKMSAVGRRQSGALITFEVIVQNQFAVGAGKNKIDAGSLEIPVEEQLRVGDDNRVGRSVRGVNRLYVGTAA